MFIKKKNKLGMKSELFKQKKKKNHLRRDRV